MASDSEDSSSDYPDYYPDDEEVLEAEDGADEDDDVPEGVPAGIPTRKRGKYNAEIDLLNPEVLQRQIEEHIDSTRIMTSPRICLAVASGFISNVNIHEREIVNRAVPTCKAPVFNSNFGRKTYQDYMMPAPKQKTTRGRKPKKTMKKERKRQGNGGDMASQASIYITSRSYTPAFGYIVEPEAPMYKTKVFCTGDVQVPNATQIGWDDMIACMDDLVEAINDTLHDGEPVSKLLYIHPTLKNYKFRLSLPENHIIDLVHLRRLLSEIKDTEENGDIPGMRSGWLQEPLSTAPEHPRILHVVYNRSKDSNLAVKFITPFKLKAKKALRFNVYIDGSLTILGGLYMDVTRQICAFMNWLFETNYLNLIVRVCAFPPEQNVVKLSHNECVDIFYQRKRAKIREMCKKHLLSQRMTEKIMDLMGCNERKYYSHA